MALGETFSIFKRDNKDWVWIKDLVAFLKSSWMPSDSAKSVKPANIERVLKGYREGVTTFPNENGQEETAVPIISIMRFIFHFMDNMECCSKLAWEIAEEVCQQSNEENEHVPVQEDTSQGNTDTDPPDLILHLYQKIANIDFYSKRLSDIFVCDIKFEESDIPDMYEVHKSQFSHEEWGKICLFESHFQMSAQAKVLHDSSTLEQKIKAKHGFLDDCMKAKSTGSSLLEQSRLTIKRRLKRKIVAKRDDCIHIHVTKTHIPTVIEEEIHTKLADLIPDTIDKAICIDNISTNSNSIQVFLQVSKDDTSIESFRIVSKAIQRLLERYHGIHRSEISFFAPDTFDICKDTDSISINRFKLRDIAMLGNLQEQTLHSTTEESNQMLITEGGEQCETCFLDNGTLPLSCKDFQLTQEWFLDVPLEVQLVLLPFINMISVNRAKDPSFLYNTKINRLYSIVDELLNVNNYHYHGVLQESNTNEMIMTYRNASSIFNLTSSAGATQSLTKAECSLKERSTSEILYYESILKKYPLTYKTISELHPINKLVSMRDCHVNFLIDNLVRLTINNDPSRGESRSKQMNTLPVTLEGLPHDAYETTLWHDEGICDKSEFCPCKKPVQLKKEDIDSALFELSQEEQDAWNQYQKLLTFGAIKEMWQEISEQSE